MTLCFWRADALSNPTSERQVNRACFIFPASCFLLSWSDDLAGRPSVDAQNHPEGTTSLQCRYYDRDFLVQRLLDSGVVEGSLWGECQQ